MTTSASLSGTGATATRRVARGPIDPRLLRHARGARGGIALLAAIGTGQAAATLAVAVALTWIVAPAPSRTHLPGGTRAEAIMLLAGAFAARGLLSWAEQVAARRTAARVTDELRRSLLAAVVRRGPAWVARYGAGRLTTVLGTGLDALRPWFSGYLPSLILGLLLPPAVIAVIALVDPASAVIALLTLPLVPLLGALIGWATQTRARQRWAADARLAGHFLDVVRGLGTLKTYGRAERQTGVIAGLTDRHRRATLRVLRVAFLSSTALDLVGTLSVGLIAVEAGLRVAGGSMSLAPALLAILLAPEAYRPLREMAARYHAATDATAVIADVDEILAGPAPSAVTAPRSLPLSTAWTAITARNAPSVTSRPAPAGPHRGNPGRRRSAGDRHREATVNASRQISAGPDRGNPHTETTISTSRQNSAGGRSGTVGISRAVTPGTANADWSALAMAARWGVLAAGLRASYPGAGGDAVSLDDLSVRAGEVVALRGPSGAGKSTALRVLAGLHTADAGAVAVGRAFHLSQRPALPHARTVGEAFAEDATGGEIRAALRMVGLDTEVTAETPLGEHGNGISAGQRQRLALAALLHRAGRDAAEHPHHGEPGPRRRPAPVVTLLLDEPTAHLDPAAERLVVARLREFARRGCAVLVVAHRPALLAAADRIVDVQAPLAGADEQDRHPAVAASVTQSGTAQPGTAQPGTAQPGTAQPALPGGAPAGQCGGNPEDRAPGLWTTGLCGKRPADEQNPAAGTDLGVPAATAHPPVTPSPGSTPPNPPVPGPEPAPAGPEPTDTGTQTTDTSPQATDDPATPWWQRLWMAVALGAASVLAGILLTGSAAWLLVRAATLPPVLTLSAAVVLVRGSAVARPLLRYLERLVAHDVAFARLGRRRAAVYADLIPRVPGPRLHRRGDLLTRLVDDVDARVDGLLRGWLPALTATVAVVAAGAAVAGIVAAGAPAEGNGAAGAGIAPGLAGTLALGVLISAVIAPLVAARQADRQDAATGMARAALRDAMVETVDGVEELGAGAGRAGIPDKASRTLANLEARAAWTAGLSAAIAQLGWAVAAAGTALALDGAGMSAEWSAVLLLGVIALGEPVTALPEAAVALRRAAGAERRVAALTAEPASTIPRANETANGTANETVNRNANETADGAVTVSGLVAGWDPAAEPALDGVDLKLAPGAKVAVTGRSGSGKSTLGAVLGGLLGARAGEVRVGGKAVLVGDETGHVFASTVRENLRLAAPAATDPQLVAALRRVGLGPWLAALPDGLDTWLGTGGSTMSGGQRRRFATARALLADPALLILDEPTEGIDEAGARELMMDLLDAASGRTVLVFAHRTDGLDLVDEIYELSGRRLNVGVL